MNEFGNIILYNLFWNWRHNSPKDSEACNSRSASCKWRGNGEVSICRPALGMVTDGGDISLCCDSRISFTSFLSTWFRFSNLPVTLSKFSCNSMFLSSWTIFASVNSCMSFSIRVTLTLTDLNSSSKSFFSLSSRPNLALRALISSFLDLNSTVNSWFCSSSFSMAFCSSVISLFFSSICFFRDSMSSICWLNTSSFILARSWCTSLLSVIFIPNRAAAIGSKSSPICLTCSSVIMAAVSKSSATLFA